MSDTDEAISRFFCDYRPLWVPINLDQLARVVAPVEIAENPFLNAQWVCDLLGAIQLPGHLEDQGLLTCTYGGFLEDRSHLWRGHYFKKGAIHLGVDLNAPSGIAVCLPCEGTLVESFTDPDQDGGWGGRVTFDCGGAFLTFGHLAGIPPEDLVGSRFPAGRRIGLIADRSRNGGWYDHLHIQASRTFDPARDGYADELYDGIEDEFLDPIEFVRRK